MEGPGCLRPNARTGMDSADLPGPTSYPLLLVVTGRYKIPKRFWASPRRVQEAQNKMWVGQGGGGAGWGDPPTNPMGQATPGLGPLWGYSSASVRINSPLGLGPSSRAGNVRQFVFIMHTRSLAAATFN